uniref:Uncharacterized protein n=1 Tax=Candidatus Kentrum sp. DK TaxID=2126562 RepID=A0A450T3K6_9GAMM|nr:MAG: hypothetical protein BECKDK2373B_GA0170837_10983 [Candidatus Kentron sp. DK]
MTYEHNSKVLPPLIRTLFRLFRKNFQNLIARFPHSTLNC